MDIKIDLDRVTSMQADLEVSKNLFEASSSGGNILRLTTGALGHAGLSGQVGLFYASWESGRSDILSALDALTASLEKVVSQFESTDRELAKQFKS